MRSLFRSAILSLLVCPLLSAALHAFGEKPLPCECKTCIPVIPDPACAPSDITCAPAPRVTVVVPEPEVIFRHTPASECCNKHSYGHRFRCRHKAAPAPATPTPQLVPQITYSMMPVVSMQAVPTVGFGLATGVSTGFAAGVGASGFAATGLTGTPAGSSSLLSLLGALGAGSGQSQGLSASSMQTLKSLLEGNGAQSLNGGTGDSGDVQKKMSELKKELEELNQELERRLKSLSSQVESNRRETEKNTLFREGLVPLLKKDPNLKKLFDEAEKRMSVPKH